MDNIEIVSLELINSNKDAVFAGQEKHFQRGLGVKKGNIFFLCIRFSTRFLFLLFANNHAIYFRLNYYFKLCNRFIHIYLSSV